MNAENKIVAVVVTYNRKELLRKNLIALLNQEEYSTDIIVVDNASSDGTAEMIFREFNVSQLIYRNTGSNLGGAGGFQYGIREAMKNPNGYMYDYVWIMDDDTIPQCDSLKELLAADKELNGKWGWLSSVAYWTDGTICRMNIQKKNIFKHVGKNEYNRKISPVKMCSFVSLLVKASVIREVGLPIGEYFIWTDDYEFTGRISRKYPCYMVTKSKVIHAMKNHLRVIFAKDAPERINRYYYIYRNDVHCYRQYGVQGWFYIILKNSYTIIDILLRSKGEKMKKIKVLFQGFLAGISFKPTVEKIRGSIK